MLHSFYGCDTTSRFFAHPSYKALTMFCAHLAAELVVFKNSNLAHSEIHEAGSKLVAAMYKCDPDLSSERLRLFKIKCNSKTSKRDYPHARCFGSPQRKSIPHNTWHAWPAEGPAAVRMEARRWVAGANPDETGTGTTASDGDEKVCVCATGSESKRCECV